MGIRSGWEQDEEEQVASLRRLQLGKVLKEVRYLDSGSVGIPGRGNSWVKDAGTQAAWQLENQLGVQCVWSSLRRERSRRRSQRPERKEPFGAVMKGFKGLNS